MSSARLSLLHCVGADNWRDPDVSVLDDRRGAVPAVPAGAAAATVARLDGRYRARRRARRRTMSCSQCWQASPPCAGRACGCASRRPGTSRWCCGRRWWASPRPASRRRWRPMRRLLEAIEQERRRTTRSGARRHAEQLASRRGEATPFVPSQVVATDADPAAAVWPTSSRAIRAACCCGATVPAAWIGDDGRRRRPSRPTGSRPGRPARSRVAPPRQPARSLGALPRQHPRDASGRNG